MEQLKRRHLSRMDNCWLAALVPHKRFTISVESAHDLHTDIAFEFVPEPRKWHRVSGKQD